MRPYALGLLAFLAAPQVTSKELTTRDLFPMMYVKNLASAGKSAYRFDYTLPSGKKGCAYRDAGAAYDLEMTLLRDAASGGFAVFYEKTGKKRGRCIEIGSVSPMNFSGFDTGIKLEK